MYCPIAKLVFVPVVMATVALTTVLLDYASAEETFPLQFRGAPPVNVGARDAVKLIANNVFVAHFAAPEPGRKGGVKLRVFYASEDWNVIGCAIRSNGKYSTLSGFKWPAKFHDKRLGLLIPGAADSLTRNDPSPEFGAYYHNAETGRIVLLDRGKNRRWYPRNTGHLQERLPASVYTLCPDFPPASELGLEVNHAQTALTYPELVAQDSGRRVRRPDLITDNPIEVVE